MKKIFTHILVSLLLFSSLSGCGRDLSSSTYTSDSTLNVVLHGKVLAKREVNIKETEKLGDNSTGALGGAIAGGTLMSSNTRSSGATVAGALIGSVAGAAVQSALSTSKGTEYIVQVDKSKLEEDYYAGSRSIRNALSAVRATGIITVVQAKEGSKTPKISEGQDVLVILSDNRTRIIPASY